jgi:hypothetical protein
VTGARLVRLYAAGRRVPCAMLAIAACAIGLRIALLGHWDAYGALQLPLIFEAAAAVSVVATVPSAFGEQERVAGRWLPLLRLAVTVTLTAAVWALYTQWHPPALTTPWLWPARPPHDLGGALCAGLVFTCGVMVVTVRGARDRPGDPAEM